MVKNIHHEYETTKVVDDSIPQDEGGIVLGHVRIAKISYDDSPIRQSANGTEYSIGAIIDIRISEAFKSGAMISEVSLFFETREQQEKLLQFYLGK